MRAVVQNVEGLEVVHTFGDAFARGRQHGEALRDKIHAHFDHEWRNGFMRASPLLPPAVFRAWARLQGHWLCPDERDELRGVAEGSGLAYDDVLVMNSAPPFEALHSLLGGGLVSACTQIATRGIRGVLIGRNLDTVSAGGLAQAAVVMVSHPDRGCAFITPGFAGKVLDAVTGWNAHGLVVSQDTSELRFERFVGLYSGALVRRLVMGCADLTSVQRALRHAPPLCGGGRSFLAAREGDAAVFETAQRVIGPRHVSRRGWGEGGDAPDALVLTNHYRTPRLATRPASVSSSARLARALALVEGGIDDAEAMMAAMTDKIDGALGEPRGRERPSDRMICWYGDRVGGLGPFAVPADLEVRVATRVSTVCDVPARVMWVGIGVDYVSESTHFRPIDVAAALSVPPC
ncbi:MAG: hypothetical protein EB084_12345 [Proteobacteria bacterium]|nr:hypothetical protein [Pseudomonadota bacterium]